MTEDGKIYLIGGYDHNQITSKGDDYYKSIYCYDFNIKFFSKVENIKLATLRHSFGICALNKNIYVIGGFNYKEGIIFF